MGKFDSRLDSLGLNQYRNTSSSDGSQTFACKIQGNAGATGNVAKNQAALGGDAGTWAILAFKEVLQPAPTINSATPIAAERGTTIDVTINGQDFIDGAISNFNDANTIINSTIFISSTQLLVNITITTMTEIGLKTITVTNPDTQFGNGINLFTVGDPPMTTTKYSIKGQLFCNNQTKVDSIKSIIPESTNVKIWDAEYNVIESTPIAQTDKALNIDIRFHYEIDRDKMYADTYNYIQSNLGDFLKGSWLAKHTCNHADNARTSIGCIETERWSN